MIVAELMHKHICTIRPGASLAQAASVMRSHRLTSLPVTDKTGCLLGIVTHNDLVRRHEMDIESRPHNWQHRLLAPLDAAYDYVHMHTRHVAEVMTPEPVTVTPFTKVAAATALMNTMHIKRLPVMEDGRLTGMITKYDLMQHLEVLQ